MSQPQIVRVYAFRAYDAEAAEFRVVPFKAPRELIHSRYRGEVLEGTGEDLPESELDDRGCYRRIPTAWGGAS